MDFFEQSFFQVQASAAWALSPCIKNAANSGDMVRYVNFHGKSSKKPEDPFSENYFFRIY